MGDPGSTPISTLEMIKLQEQEKEVKLKEKREQENTISFLNKAIRDATVQAEKSEKEREKLIKSTDSLRKEKVLAERRRNTLSAQFTSHQTKLKELRAKSVNRILNSKHEILEMFQYHPKIPKPTIFYYLFFLIYYFCYFCKDEEISKVWEMRSSFCKEIHSVSDACDIWTLLMKPVCAQFVSRTVNKEVQVRAIDSDKRLKAAIERRIKALAERDRLATEPDNGEEFMRIKGALRYSLNKIAELNK